MEALRDRADITIFGDSIDYQKIWNILDYTVEGLLIKHIGSENFRSELFLEEAKEFTNMIKDMSTVGFKL